MTEFSGLNTARTRLFLKHICNVMSRNISKDEAKQTLISRVHRLRTFLRSKSYKKAIVESELDILEKEISKAIERGAKINRYAPTTSEISSFQKRIGSLEKAIDTYVSTYHQREQKIHELEKKIINEANTDAGSHLKKLEHLEKKFLELEDLNLFDIKQLSRIRVKIEFLKKKAKGP